MSVRFHFDFLLERAKLNLKNIKPKTTLPSREIHVPHEFSEKVQENLENHFIGEKVDGKNFHAFLLELREK